jgi:diguanylate cyclase (GGDEF)-like protein/PAS domain S-box-containing protein
MPKRMIPKGLRTRLVSLVIVSIIFSVLLLLAHERHQRDDAVTRAHSEATLLSRLAVTRAEQLIRSDTVESLTPKRALASVVLAARDAGAVVRAGYGARLPEVVTFVIVDPRGHVLAEPGSAAPARDSLIRPFEAQTTAEWHQDVRGGDGHSRAVSFVPLQYAGGSPMWVGAAVDVDALIDDQVRGLWRSLAGLFLLGLVVSLMAWRVVSVGVLRRVKALLSATRRLGDGDLAVRSGLADDTGELGALARQFDVMAEALERHEGERARAEARLRLSEARKLAVLEASLDGIVLLDSQGQMMECNATARRMFGCDGRRCEHHSFTDLFPEAMPFDSSRFNRPTEVLETSCRRLNRTTFPAEISIAPIRDPAAAGLFTVTVRDITERKLWQRSLETLSYMDDLTGLYNRRGFLLFAEHQLKLAVRNDQSVVMVGVDMDGLKAINDTFGHANGDRALVELANALRGSFRDSDVIGRIGGDEFVVLTTESNETGAEHAVERLAMRIAGRNGEGDLPWPLAASVGWVRAQPTGPEDLVTLLARVDERMYEQKRRRSDGVAGAYRGGFFARASSVQPAGLAAAEPAVPAMPSAVRVTQIPLFDDIARAS